MIYYGDGEGGVDGGGVGVAGFCGRVYFFVAALGAVAGAEGDGGDGAFDCCVAVEGIMLANFFSRWMEKGNSRRANGSRQSIEEGT